MTKPTNLFQAKPSLQLDRFIRALHQWLAYFPAEETLG